MAQGFETMPREFIVECINRCCCVIYTAAPVAVDSAMNAPPLTDDATICRKDHLASGARRLVYQQIEQSGRCDAEGHAVSPHQWTVLFGAMAKAVDGQRSYRALAWASAMGVVKVDPVLLVIAVSLGIALDPPPGARVLRNEAVRLGWHTGFVSSEEYPRYKNYVLRKEPANSKEKEVAIFLCDQT